MKIKNIINRIFFKLGYSPTISISPMQIEENKVKVLTLKSQRHFKGEFSSYKGIYIEICHELIREASNHIDWEEHISDDYEWYTLIGTIKLISPK